MTNNNQLKKDEYVRKKKKPDAQPGTQERLCKKSVFPLTQFSGGGGVFHRAVLRCGVLLCDRRGGVEKLCVSG